MEVGARTERYWCPIKHAKVTKSRHEHYEHFVDYDDGAALRTRWGAIKNFKDEV